MKSKVYFTAVTGSDTIKGINDKLKKLLEESKVLDFISKGQKVAVKAHFGEEGNTGFVSPEHVRVICDGVKGKGAVAFLSDANTLYRGRRLNSDDHLKLAYEHGFTKELTGVDVIIPDDTKNENIIDIPINQKFIKGAKIARIFVDADAIVAVNHFKGHILTGFGGALKNLGMGCATRQGKLAQHCDVAPVVHLEQCIGCGECEKICPVGAIHLENKKSVVDSAKCIGCASCLAVCPTMAMFIDFAAGDKVQEKMAEYTLAVLKGKENKAGFINFAVKISKECDCWGMENPRIAPDVGIFASLDPVSIDKASFDLVNKACGKDIFKATHPEPDGIRQLRYAQEIGLGSLDYELIEL
jgi:uncharacterized protein